MAGQVGQIVLIVFAGLVIGGLFASFAMVAAPLAWRGPWIPVVAGLAGVLFAALIRRLLTRQVPGADRGRGGR
jgi:hypothetical protein